MHRRQIAWVLALVLFVFAGGWFVVSQMNSEQTSSGGGTSQATEHQDWQDQLVHLAERTSRGKEGKRGSWPFSALRRKAEPMPPYMRRAATSTLGGYQHLGLRFGQARYVGTTVGVGIWVVRGKGVTCMFQAKKAAAACTTDTNVARRGEILVVGEGAPSPSNPKLPSHVLALGIAPDSVKAVRLKAIGGRSTIVPVVDNAYGLRAGAPINLEALIR